MDVQSNLVSTFPPSFVTCSVNDGLVGHRPIFLDKLKAADITHIYKEYGHSDKFINHVFHLNIRNDEAAKLNHEQIEFFRQYMD
ncbi:hypothetical protein D3C76_1487880 [compost metagenome]